MICLEYRPALLLSAESFEVVGLRVLITALSGEYAKNKFWIERYTGTEAGEQGTMAAFFMRTRVLGSRCQITPFMS